MTVRDFHYYEPAQGHGLSHNPLNALVAPRPIGWISSRDAQGRVNLAPYSFFNAFNYDPPIIGFSSIAWKDSVQNASETREFTWNLVTRELGDQMNQTSAPLAHGEDEFPFAGLTAVAGRKVNVPRVGESRAAMECKVIDIVQFRNTAGEKVSGWLVLGEVVAVYIDKTLLKDGVYQTAEAYPIMRSGGLNDYVQVSPDNVFQIGRLPGASNAASHGKG
ncbi:flavin reductase family protein [Variovorax sp. J22G21]|uniref:flavin reductase family protein n=1 Tax=Variovorax fucosicus TaxID=3053517 RepID=UPI002575DD67|nr:MULTISPECIES: flavin reductase family protein [unclassified Variovorax]MDM0041315.1 flavin reductase family protein [Variovorax sp. J22R193]MDM0060372.1 flavin reductase family protein [Variovorax sp. J22G21]